jgi:hypothetical protein
MSIRKTREFTEIPGSTKKTTPALRIQAQPEKVGNCTEHTSDHLA